jgi:hypothetical protein
VPPTANNPDHGSPLGSTVVAFPTKQALQSITDKSYRDYDNKFPDFWRVEEWKREFDSFVTNGNLPNLDFVRIMHDHFGAFKSTVDGVNTIETQMADNDYALGTLVDTVAHNPYADSTLILHHGQYAAYHRRHPGHHAAEPQRWIRRGDDRGF